MPLTLPPLNSLRAFEAAARNGSYVKAAEELNVSPAAISQHVRKLENFLGKQLFMRANNKVVLTDAGSAVYVGAADALQSISEFTEQIMSNRSRARLVISTISSVAERWLEAKLAQYALLNPKFRFNLRVESDPVDFARDNIDLRTAPSIGFVQARLSFQLAGPSHLAMQPDCLADRDERFARRCGSLKGGVAGLGTDIPVPL